MRKPARRLPCFRRTAEDVIETGLALKRVKATLPHGQFGSWIEAELPFSYTTARRWMRIADHFADKLPKLGNFAPDVLEALAGQAEDIMAAVEAKVAASEVATRRISRSVD